MKVAVTRFLAIALLWFAAALPANAACYQWSKTAASNATADPSINWAEGMAPSAVNDSARAMMARLAECRDDISGAITTGGTSTAYTLTTNQGLPSPPTTGQMIAFTANATNGASATLATDSGAAYAIQTSSGVAIPAGTLVSGSPYTATFNGTAWILRDFFGNPYALPLGGMMDYFGSTTPNSNFVFPSGQCVSRTTYATFFAMVSTTFGVCDGTTTYGLPDLRGRGTAALDNMNGSAANRITTAGSGIDGVTLGAAGGAQNVVIGTGNVPQLAVAIDEHGGHTHTLNQSVGIAGSGAGGGIGIALGTPTISTTLTGITATANTGSANTALNKMGPTMIVYKILRIF